MRSECILEPDPMTQSANNPVGATKVLILGSPGSGKSTFAARLGAITGIAPVDLDALAPVAYRTGIKPRPVEMLLMAAGRLAHQDRWIAEGIYTSWTGPLVASAQSVVVLQTPLITCLWRVVRRHLDSGIRNEHGGLLRLLNFCLEVIDYHLNADPDAHWQDNPDRTTFAATRRLTSGAGSRAVVLSNDTEIEAWLRLQARDH